MKNGRAVPEPLQPPLNLATLRPCGDCDDHQSFPLPYWAPAFQRVPVERQAGAKRTAYVRSTGTSGAAPLIPRHRRSAARVLIDEGWVKSNQGARGGDKWCVVHRLGVQIGFFV
jgi:hypothetical protein